MADQKLTQLDPLPDPMVGTDLLYVVRPGDPAPGFKAQVNQFLAIIPPPSAINWGDIIGTLSAQTDLQAALDAKANAGDVPTTNITMASGLLVGRSTAGVGNIEGIVIGNGLDLSLGALSATPVWGDITGTISAQADLQAELNAKADQTDVDLKAPLASPTFTGTPAAPTPTALDSTTKIATTAFVTAADAVVAAAAAVLANKRVIQLAASDVTTPITAGIEKVTFRVPYAMTLTAVRASVQKAPTGSTIIIDINKNGTTVLSTKLSIDAGEKTSVTAATPPVISVSALADDDEISFDFDQVGSTFGGQEVVVTLIGTSP